MLFRLYQWTLSWANHPQAYWLLGIIAFCESSFFPIPPDVLLIALVLGRPDQAFRIAALCTVASVVGGLAGYGIGAFLFDQIGRSLLDMYGYWHQFESFKNMYHEWGFWIVMAGGFTPLPYKVITIASGASGMDITTFLIASIISRGARFFLLASLLWFFGERIRQFIDRWFALLVTIFFVGLFGGFIAIKYLV